MNFFKSLHHGRIKCEWLKTDWLDNTEVSVELIFLCNGPISFVTHQSQIGFHFAQTSQLHQRRGSLCKHQTEKYYPHLGNEILKSLSYQGYFNFIQISFYHGTVYTAEVVNDIL